jgi:ABC-type transporter Mla MlaB component
MGRHVAAARERSSTPSTGLALVTTGLQHSLEISARSATLYLAGTLAGADAFPIRRICREIPAQVSTLRLDLHGVTHLEEGAMDTIRSLVRFWRETRRGGFRLSFASEHLVATCVDAGASPSEHLIDGVGGCKAALTGMFL